MGDAMIGLVLDRSGSMKTMWKDAVGGVNNFIKEQGEAEGHAWITLNYFDHETVKLYDAWDATDIPELPVKGDIRPRGSTALIDATLRTISDVKRWLQDNAWFEGKVFIVVMTDGRENASKASGETLKAKIKEKEDEGWEFIFLAANIDTDATSKALGFNLRSSMTYDEGSVKAAYAATGQSVLHSRRTGEHTEFSERDVRSST